MNNPYLTYSENLQKRYGAKTYKVTVSGGNTCPTRDGTFGPKKGWGGCSFCDVHGSASYFANLRKELSVRLQIEAAMDAIRKKYKAEKFIAYFQSYTTTHEEIAEFKVRYDEAVKFPDIVRLAIGTRPDCLPNSVLELLGTYLDRVDVQLEIGVQSLDDKILDWYDRGHDAQTAIDAIQRAITFSQNCKNLYPNKIFDVSAHLILGAPQETPESIVSLAKQLNDLKVHGVKLHHLHVLKKTKLANRYQKGEFTALTLDEYFERASLLLRHLDPKIVIHRTHGLAPHPEELIAPEWSTLKIFPVQQLKEKMLKNNWRQGDLL